LESFKASAQYGDWKGTVAADSQPSGLREWLEENKLIEDGEFLVAATLYVSEHNFDSPHVRAFVFENARKFESVRDAIAATKGPIPVREVRVNLSTEEFFDLFKRFDVMLTWHGLELEGREYSAKES
jgi:hypothetical protein